MNSPAIVAQFVTRPLPACVVVGLCAVCQGQPLPTGVHEIPLAGQSMSASGRFLLLDDDLRAFPVDLLSISQGEITLRDEHTRVREFGTDEIVALLPPTWDDMSIDPGLAGMPKDERAWLTLVDGQRIPGTLATTGDGSGETVLWTHELFGTLAFSLERVREITLSDEGSSDDVRTEDDLVQLRNGDRISGFIEQVQPTVVIESRNGRLEMTPEQVSRIRLVNDPARLTGALAWTRDGGTIALRDVRLEEDERRVSLLLADTPDDEHLYLQLHDLRGLAFDAGRVHALSSLEIVREQISGTRRFGNPVQVSSSEGEPFGAADVLLPGPMLVEWRLPMDPSHLRGHAILPRAARIWGDFELIFEAVDSDGGTRELLRERLRSSEPSVLFNVALDARDSVLRVRIEAGEYGPIQDRVVLRRVVVLGG